MYVVSDQKGLPRKRRTLEFCTPQADPRNVAEGVASVAETAATRDSVGRADDIPPVDRRHRLHGRQEMSGNFL